MTCTRDDHWEPRSPSDTVVSVNGRITGDKLRRPLKSVLAKKIARRLNDVIPFYLDNQWWTELEIKRIDGFWKRRTTCVT